MRSKITMVPAHEFPHKLGIKDINHSIKEFINPTKKIDKWRHRLKKHNDYWYTLAGQ